MWEYEIENYKLRYNVPADRFGIWDPNIDDWHVEELHYGACFTVRYQGKDYPVRLEIGGERDVCYLWGFPFAGVPLEDLEVPDGRVLY